jgi:hypothetical protein
MQSNTPALPRGARGDALTEASRLTPARGQRKTGIQMYLDLPAAEYALPRSAEERTKPRAPWTTILR